MTGGGIVVSLREPRAGDPRLAGQKAARLSALLAAGFDVPAGSVIPVATCGDWPRLAEAATSLLRDELAGTVAVRSSAVAEDLGDASFAGLYASVLSVDGDGALRDAVTHVIASAGRDRVRRYGDGEPVEMAVLVQRQIEARAAGVAFSADPLTGARDVVLVHAVEGLGESLVSGTEDPEEWTVGPGASCRHARGVLREAQARAVAELVRRVEAHVGEPVDIEWAIDGDGLWLLQCRPITALPVRPELPDLPASETWARERAHWSEPVTPFGASIYFPALGYGTQVAFAEFGLLVERIEMISRGGEPYLRAVEVAGPERPAADPDDPALPAALRDRLESARRAVREGRLASVPAEWVESTRDAFQGAIDRLLDEDVDALSDARLCEHIARATELLRRGHVQHFRLSVPYMVAMAELLAGCRELFGWSAVESLRLLSGLSSASSAPTRALRELAARVADRPDLREALARLTRGDELEAVDADFAAAFASFVRRFGWKAVHYDPGSLALAERPELIAGLVLDAVERVAADRVDAERMLAERDARRALAGRPEELARFEALLEAARANQPLREENIALTDNLPCGLLRRAMLACGRRLVARERLRSAEEARFLTVDELTAALGPGAELDPAPLAARRRAEELWVRAHPGPERIGPAPAPAADPAWLPPESRRLTTAFSRILEDELSPPRASGANELRGRAGSPGRATGPVRVVRSESDFGRLRYGDVLVCPTTSPAWSVLFGNASALVTDGGGAMSHAAIIAREHGIPAVLATGDATRRLRDGERVVVDGNTGTVTRSSGSDR